MRARRWIALLMLAALPFRAYAASFLPFDPQDALNAFVTCLDGLTLTGGEQFSLNETVPLNGEAAGIAATAVWKALRQLPADTVSFDELSLSEDGRVLVDAGAGLDFRFTYLGSGTLRLSAAFDGGKLRCEAFVDAVRVSLQQSDEAAAMAGAALDTVRMDFSDDPDALQNATLAAMSLFDLTLAKDDVFSMNALAGPYLSEYGYVEAECGDGTRMVGGGVDRLASALWLLVQNRSDITVIEKNTYGAAYCKDYVDNAAEAIAVDSALEIDFSFRYTGSGTLTFYAQQEGDALTVALSGQE